MHGHGPALLGWLLAAVCGGTGAYCLARLRGRRSAGHRQRPATDGLMALMGLGMALMALPATGPPAPPPQAFAALFAAAALWSLALLRTGRAHHGHHLLESLAMVYMALAMTGTDPAASHGGAHAASAGPPVVTGLLLAYFAGYALRAGHRLLTPAGTQPVPPGSAGMPPEVATACRLTLALGMVTMLLTL
jgi:hypothetical protein